MISIVQEYLGVSSSQKSINDVLNDDDPEYTLISKQLESLEETISFEDEYVVFDDITLPREEE